MKIFLRTLDSQIFLGKLIALEVSPMSSIKTVKANIQDLENVPAEDMTIFFSGKRLEDEGRVSDLKIANESTLVLALKSKGSRPPLYGIEGIKRKFRKLQQKSDAVSELNESLVRQNLLMSKR
jgi:hypothetical protein